jgi:hypothetical protein
MADTGNDILELKFDGNGINPSIVKPSEIAQLIDSFEKALIATIKQNSPEINTDIVLFTFESIKDESLELRFALGQIKVKDAVLAGYLLIATSVSEGNFNRLDNGTITHLRTFTRFSKKYNCNGYFNRNNKTISSFTPSTEFSLNKSKTIKSTGQLYGKIIDAGGDNPNVHLKINDEQTIIFNTDETNAKKLASKLYEKVCLLGEIKWDAETYKVEDFKLTEILDYAPGNTYNAIHELKKITSGYWDNFNTNDEINNQLLRD